MILAGRFASADDVRRFYAEARAAGSLRHLNLVGIHEVGEIGCIDEVEAVPGGLVRRWRFGQVND